nr:tyrosinase family protein [Aquabacterium terrae]
MRALPARDPASWTFQWYIHAVRDDRTEAQELQAAFGGADSPVRRLAARVWNTCQAHQTTDRPTHELYFLPWHRMYVHYFERICRRVLGDENFTLPYWDYVNGSSVLPAPFRDRGSPLFHADRTPAVNAGGAIDTPQTRLQYADALANRNFARQGGDFGFSLTLESRPHNVVHGNIGTGRGMGSVEWAAADPIFWLHHCNIDRVWASWNALGRRNPGDAGWLDASFTFADEAGREVNPRNRDFTDITRLGLRYDRLEAAPRGASAESDDFAADLSPPAGSTTMSTTRHRAAPSGGIPLGGQAIQVTLPAQGPRDEHEAADEAAGDKRSFLVLNNFRADAPPGVTYHVYLGLPPGTSGREAARYYVGPLSFFDAVPRRGHAAHFSGKSTSFDVTALVRRLRSEGRWQGTPAVTIAPAGAPASSARPLIGDISIVEQ